MSNDDHAQPTPGMNAARVAGRTLDELIGICRGVMADGELATSEGEFMLRWMEANRHLASVWPAERLYRRLAAMLVDRKLDLDEQAELMDLIQGLIGGTVELPDGAASAASTLPLDDPPPSVEFAGRTFVVTGRFVFGTRAAVHAAIAERGGIALDAVTRRVNFLVVGSIGSRDWLHSTFGRKILQARDLKSAGAPIAVVGEEHWTKALQPSAPPTSR